MAFSRREPLVDPQQTPLSAPLVHLQCLMDHRAHHGIPSCDSAGRQSALDLPSAKLHYPLHKFRSLHGCSQHQCVQLRQKDQMECLQQTSRLPRPPLSTQSFLPITRPLYYARIRSIAGPDNNISEEAPSSFSRGTPSTGERPIGNPGIALASTPGPIFCRLRPKDQPSSIPGVATMAWRIFD
jgi:hypothetical protein